MMGELIDTPRLSHRRRRRKRKHSLASRVKKRLPRALILIGLALVTATFAYMVAAHVNSKPPEAVGGP
jgi:hypothetical protein